MNIYVKLDIRLETQQEAFDKVVDYAIRDNIVDISNKQELVDAFIRRESEFSTSLGEGFAIPHAVSKNIDEIAIVYFRFKTKSNNGIKWDDKNFVKYAIFLMIPEAQRNSQHVEILSQIATKLLDNSFKNKLINSKSESEILNLLANVNANKQEQKQNDVIGNKGSKNILAITACPVGIAHTYLAAEKIEQAAKSQGYNIKVETHGSVGVKNEFSKSDIENADLVIIASDIGIDTSRFVGIPIYEARVKEAVDNSNKLINDAFNKAIVLSSSDKFKKGNIDATSQKEGKIIKHLLSGVSYMIPFIIFGGLLIALSLGISKAIYGEGSSAPSGSILWYVEQFGAAAFGLMIPILGGFIANSIAGRAAIAPAMIVSFIANNTSLIFKLPGIPSVDSPMGFIGAILFGIMIGYTVKWINTWKFHKNVAAIVPIFIIPLGVTIFYALLSSFVIAPPIAFVMSKFSESMKSLFTSTDHQSVGIRVGVGLGMGLVIGAMAGFDMGGPINKIAFVTCSALISEKIYNPMGMMAAAIPIAPLSMGIATLVYKNKFDKQQKSLGISAIIMGSIGISEGAIPFAVSDPKRVFISNVVGSSIAGGIAGALGVTNAVAHGGPIVGILGAVGGSFIGSESISTGLGIGFFFISIVVGTIVSVLVYGLLLKLIKDNKQEKVVIKNNKFKVWFADLKSNISNSSFSQKFKLNRYIIGYSLMWILSISMLIMGTVFVCLDANNLKNAIQSHQAPSTLCMYGLFGLLWGLVIAIYAGIYTPTILAKKKEMVISNKI